MGHADWGSQGFQEIPTKIFHGKQSLGQCNAVDLLKNTKNQYNMQY